MELRQAISDLEEVRDRLVGIQRFEGYSAPAAFASGIVALVAGFAQWRIAPLPHSQGDFERYVLIWMSCLAAALALNYGAVAAWLWNHREPGAASRFRSAARSIAPSVVLGGLLTVALVDRGAYELLPGTWFAFYAVGLFASRNAIPQTTFAVTLGFTALAALFLVSPLRAIAPAWWVMPLGFGIGQIAIGALIWRERPA